MISSFVNQGRPWLKGDSIFKINYYLTRDFQGYGIIDAIVRDQKVEDVSCDGHQMRITYEKIQDPRAGQCLKTRL